MNSFYRFAEPVPMNRGTHFGNNYYLIPSIKLGRTVKAFSNLEYYNILRLEMDPTVEYYCEQCTKAVLFNEHGQKIRKVVPDVYVVYTDGIEEIEEVKYSNDLKGDRSRNVRAREQVAAEKLWAAQCGMAFLLCTEENVIPHSCTIQNYDFIHQRLRRMTDWIPNEDICREIIHHLIVAKSPLSVRKLCDVVHFECGMCWDYLAYMHYKGNVILPIDNDKPLNMKSEVKV